MQNVPFFCRFLEICVLSVLVFGVCNASMQGIVKIRGEGSGNISMYLAPKIKDRTRINVVQRADELPRPPVRTDVRIYVKFSMANFVVYSELLDVTLQFVCWCVFAGACVGTP